MPNLRIVKNYFAKITKSYEVKEMPDTSTIYDRLQQAVKMQKTSLQNLGKQIGVGTRSLYNWKTNDPSLETVVKVCAELNVPLTWMVYGEEEKKEESLDELFPKDPNRKISIDLSQFSKNIHDAVMADLQYDDSNFITDEEADLIELYRRASERDKKLVRNILDEYKEDTDSAVG